MGAGSRCCTLQKPSQGYLLLSVCKSDAQERSEKMIAEELIAEDTEQEAWEQMRAEWYAVHETPEAKIALRDVD